MRARPSKESARLRVLSGEERLAFARQVLRESDSPTAVGEALGVLQAADDPSLREAIVARYPSCETRWDPGCGVRTGLLRALRHRALPGDVPLLDAACRTYELRRPGPEEIAGDLRGAALLCLADVDLQLAQYHAVRLLDDQHTAAMSGEPAVTAARLLRETEQPLPLYACAARRQQAHPEVLAECLRSLTAVPGPVLRELVERHLGDHTGEQTLLALFDLLLGHRERAAVADLVLDFLRRTALVDVFRYVVTTIVAGRDAELLEGVLDDLAAEAGAGTPRGDILGEALALLPSHHG